LLRAKRVPPRPRTTIKAKPSKAKKTKTTSTFQADAFSATPGADDDASVTETPYEASSTMKEDSEAASATESVEDIRDEL